MIVDEGTQINNGAGGAVPDLIDEALPHFRLGGVLLTPNNAALNSSSSKGKRMLMLP